MNVGLQGQIDSPHPYHTRAVGCASVGAIGVVASTPAQTANGTFKTIARISAGVYDVTLSEPVPSPGFNATLPVVIQPSVQSAAVAIADGIIARCSAQQVTNTTTPKFTITCTRSDTQAAADPPNPSVLVWTMDFPYVAV